MSAGEVVDELGVARTGALPGHGVRVVRAGDESGDGALLGGEVREGGPRWGGCGRRTGTRTRSGELDAAYAGGYGS